jgi:TetR/AcrR family transcriptional regulator
VTDTSPTISTDSDTRAGTSRRRRGIGRPAAGATHCVGREVLIEKACELLTKLPPSKVTRAAVARASGVDPSLIRYYFRDRATLLLSAVERLTRQFVTMVEDDTRAHDDVAAEDRLRSRVVSLLRLIHAYPHFHQLIVDEVAGMHSPEASELLGRLTDRGLASYRSIINSGVEAGSMRRVDVRLLFIAIIGMSHFFVSGSAIVRSAMGDNAYDEDLMERYGRFICDLLLRGLRTP